MTLKNLVTFGDSWPFGSDLLPGEKTCGQLVAESLNLNFINYSEPSTAIEHLPFQLKYFLNTYKTTTDFVAIFFLTEFSRSIKFIKDTHDPVELHPTNEPIYGKHFYSDELHIYRANLVLSHLQSVCKQYSIIDFYVPLWTTFDIMLHGIDAKKINKFRCIDHFSNLKNQTLKQLIKSKNEYLSYGHHPNQLGHNKIAELLTPWIKENII